MQRPKQATFGHALPSLADGVALRALAAAIDALEAGERGRGFAAAADRARALGREAAAAAAVIDPTAAFAACLAPGGPRPH